MVINHFGEGAFRLQNGDLSLLVDPSSNRLKADIILRTLRPVGNSPSCYSGPDQPFEIDSAGEYEVRGIEILGVPLKEESGEKFLKTVYLVKWDDIHFAFLGHLSRLPSEEIMDKLDETEVLILPAAGGHFLSAADAVKLAKQLEPNLILPSFLKSSAELQKILGEKIPPQEKLVFKKKDLANEGGKFVVLEARN